MQKKRKEKTEQGKKRVVMVDDHPIFRQGLAQLINQATDLTVCGEADDALSAMEVITQLKPDVVLLDITLKGSSGLELIKEIKKHDHRLAILVLSMHDESVYAERALRAGAMGYVTKEEATERVLTAIRHVLNGKIFLSEEMSSQMLNKFATSKLTQRRSSLDSLSDRELEVFALVGRGLGTREVSEKMHLSIKTIETHREHIKQKLNLKNATELARRAIQWVESETESVKLNK